MPTSETWDEDRVLVTQWNSPLTADELGRCFQNLAKLIATEPVAVPILFDLHGATTLPAQAPILAIRSGFLTLKNTGQVAVVSSDVIAEILARVATSITRHDIQFFARRDEALRYLHATQPNVEMGQA